MFINPEQIAQMLALQAQLEEEENNLPPEVIEANNQQEIEILQEIVDQEKQRLEAEDNTRRENAQERQGNYFHNPYNFIPAISRDAASVENVTKHPLGDRSPIGHAAYYPDYWSGRLRIKLTTRTPLLIPDVAKAKVSNDNAEHHSFPMRMVDGKPYLAPTSIKGMLRSAYEVVTNSRMGIFHGHGDRLAYRMPARDGLSLVPARITDAGKGIQLLLGTTNNIPTPNNHGGWHIPGGLMYAAWLPRYRHQNNQITPHAPQFNGMKHGQKVRAWVQQIDKLNRAGHPIFSYWRVCKNGLVPIDQELPQQPELLPLDNPGQHQPTEEVMQVEGYLCLTGKNIDNKYNERLFFIQPNHLLQNQLNLQLDNSECRQLNTQWKELICNYQAEHQRDIAKGQLELPQAQHGAQLSHHITGRRGASQAEEADLREGTLCYARVESHNQELKIVALYPVMIARTLFDLSPEKLLDDSLKPATSIDQLSPADRVFGWANQAGSSAYKGQLRIHSVECKTEEPIQDFSGSNNGDGIRLAIMGEPKPTQTQFYIAADQQGNAPTEPFAKSAGYKFGEPKQGLRGRKVYPHHSSTLDNSDYWQPGQPPQLRTKPKQKGQEGQKEQVREYLQPGQEASSQNRSIQSWVKPDTEFEFDIDVVNLSEEELQALVWLLNLPKDHYHRLGGGKGLGFGSVSLSVESASLMKGQDLREKVYGQLGGGRSPHTLTGEELEAWLEDKAKAFEPMLEGLYENSQRKLLQPFLLAARGFQDGLATHYPRLTRTPDANGENFKWFTQNERNHKKALSMLWEGDELPYQP